MCVCVCVCVCVCMYVWNLYVKKCWNINMQIFTAGKLGRQIHAQIKHIKYTNMCYLWVIGSIDGY